MIFSRVQLVFVPFLAVFLMISSLLLGKAISPALLILFGFLFIAVILFNRKHPALCNVNFVFLGLFHWFSQLNWCSILYYILIVLTISKKSSYSQTMPIALLYTFQYTVIRLSYQPPTFYNLLVSAYDVIASLLIVVFLHYLINSELERKRLRSKNNYLTTHDPLTGLLNYEGYMNTMEDLVRDRRNFVLVLLDIQDFKSVNHENMRNGNEILNNVSMLLNVFFSNSLAISRFAGDRFAVILPAKENIQQDIGDLLESNVLGFQVTYSITLFPEEAVEAQELISMAEDRLFQNRRKLWLKREENMFRSEKMKVVGELAAGMAHEIRNPLTTIKGFMQISRKNNFNIQPWFDVIMSEVTRMSELTAEFLQFSKPHISNMKSDSISYYIKRLLFLTESEALYRGHKILLEDTNESLTIYVDRDKIVQVLLNLVRNAFEAMQEPGSVYIRVLQEEKSAVIEIEDTGSGIPESELAAIFHPFYTTKENGTGLGLSICQKIVQDHGGGLDVKSAPGRGSLFRLKLPIHLAAEEDYEHVEMNHR